MTVTRSTRAAFAAVRASKRSAIEAIADNQRRMIVTAQLCACGLTTSDIRGRVLSGTLREALRNLYLVGTNVFDEPRFRLGACLSYGGDAALTARASLDGWNFTRFTRRQRDTPLEIVTRTARRRRIDGVQLLRSSRFTSDHRVWHDGEWLASVLWTITDLGRSLTPYQIANVIHEAAFHHDVWLTDIEDLLTLRGPFPGARNVRRAIAIVRSGSAGTRSFSEDRFIELAAMVTSRKPVVNTPRLFGCEWIEPDFVWLRERIIVEIDGGQHGATRHSQLSDAGRDAAYRAAGFTVIRISSRAVWEQPAAVADRLARALGIAQGQCLPRARAVTIQQVALRLLS